MEKIDDAISRILPVVRPETKKEIVKILLKELGDLGDALGYITHFTETTTPIAAKNNNIIEIPAKTPISAVPKAKRKKYRKMEDFIGKPPYKIHGRSFPHVRSILIAYGKSNQWFRYQVFEAKKTLDDIFPEPPPQTIRKKTDANGDKYVAL